MAEEERPESEYQDEAETRAPMSGKDAGLAFLAGLVVLGVTIYFGIAQGFVTLVVFPGIPLVLLWFVYWVFLRRLFRIRRIRAAQERRLMMEAARRRERR